jgi:protoporphyrinogen oxidase
MSHGANVNKELGILGAGASGLSLALLTDLDYMLIERSERAGGHAVSTSVDGWVFDRGPHNYVLAHRPAPRVHGGKPRR